MCLLRLQKRGIFVYPNCVGGILFELLENLNTLQTHKSLHIKYQPMPLNLNLIRQNILVNHYGITTNLL